MTTMNNIDQAIHAEIASNAGTVRDGQADGHGDNDTKPAPQSQAANGADNRGKPESELRASARRHGYTLKELAQLMGVSYRYLSQVSSGRRPWSLHDAGKGHGRSGRGPRAGHRLPPGRRRHQREQRHPGAGQGAGNDPQGPGRRGGNVLPVHDPGGKGPAEHEPVDAGQGGVGAGRPGGNRPRPVRQPPGVHRQRRQQLHQGTGPGIGPEHGGTGGPGRGEPGVHVRRGKGPPEPEPKEAGAYGSKSWTLPSGSRPPSLPPWTPGRCGTAWMPTISARTRRRGGPASAQPISPRS